MKKSRKYTLIVFAGFILFIVLLLLFTQTSYFKNQVKKKLTAVVENQLNAGFEIEKLEGNFYSNIRFKNIRLSQNDSTVALFPSLYLQYNLWELSGRIISIDSLIIDKPQINVWQTNDSTWNLSSIVKTKTTNKAKKPFNYKINAKHLALKNGGVSITSFSELIPRTVSNMNLLVNGSYKKDKTNIHLQKFNFATQNPSLVLENLSAIYKMNNDGIQVDSLLLISSGSNINFNGQYVSKENLNSTIDASRIDNKELAIFIPSFKLLCSPALLANFTSKNDSAIAEAELKYNNQSLKAKISFSTLDHLLSKKESIPYFADLYFDNFRIENWIETNERKALVDGNVHVSGANLLDLNSNMSISANLENSEYQEVVFDTLTFNGIYNKDSLNAILDVNSDYGGVQISGVLNNISSTPAYTAQIQSTNFNLSAFAPKIKGTTVNAVILAEGTGLNIKDLRARAELQLKQSSIYELPIDSLQANVSLNKSKLNIDSLQLGVPGAIINGSGNLNLDSLFLETKVNAHISSTNVIDSFVILPIQFDSLTTITSISGPVNELEIGGDVEIYNATGYDVKTARADANYLVSLKKDSLNVKVNAVASSVLTGPAYWDTTIVDFNYNKTGMDIDANVIWNDTINASFLTHINTGDTMSFEIPRFEAKTILSSFYLPDTMRARIFTNETIEIENFRIKDYNRENFVLAANGTISSSDTNAFEIEVNQFDLKQLNRIFEIPDSLKGKLETDISITGTAQNPTVSGLLEIENPQYGKYSLSSLFTKFDYSDQNGFAELSTPDLGNTFYASINAPFKAYIDSLKFVFNTPDTFNANVVLDSLEVAQFSNHLIHTDSISGIINGEVEANGEFSNPQFFGELDFTNGHVVENALGIDYKQIHTSVVFDGKRIIMDTVLIQQDKGLVSITGDIEFDSTLVKGNIKSSSLQMDANNFFITRHRNYELLIDANSFVKTDRQNPEFGGNIKVLRSDVYLPSILSDNKTDIENDVPLLLQALQSPGDSVHSEGNIDIKKSLSERKKNRYYDNLTGRLNVEIPRNTWIKNDDMRLELSGEVDIIKTGSYFEIFGNIDIIRGQYIFYGKRLNVKESQIVFQGGEELDPIVNIVAEYIYRGSDKEKRYLELIISGKVSEPELSFLLDDAEITEKDGISVLLFGVTSDEISYGGQNGMVSSMGSSAVASVLTSQLSRTVGTQLNLDMIEITSTENWESAAFVVGKYITNDIYVTYQRGFGEEEDDEITPERITVEYEINDKFFIRLESGTAKTSGIDIILKFEQELDKTPVINKDN